MAKSTEVATMTLADMVDPEGSVPAHISEGTGRGNENVGANLTIPRIKQLQKMSTEVDEHGMNYIEGAKPGNLINSLTGRIYGNELYVISLKFKDDFVVWGDRNKNIPMLGVYESQAAAEFAISETEVPENYSVTQTHSHILLVKDPATGQLESQPVIMDFAVSKMRVSKDWNSQIAMKGGDRFAGLWKLESVATANKQGQQFMNLGVEFVGWSKEEDYKAAEALYEAYS